MLFLNQVLWIHKWWCYGPLHPEVVLSFKRDLSIHGCHSHTGHFVIVTHKCHQTQNVRPPTMVLLYNLDVLMLAQWVSLVSPPSINSVRSAAGSSLHFDRPFVHPSTCSTTELYLPSQVLQTTHFFVFPSLPDLHPRSKSLNQLSTGLEITAREHRWQKLDFKIYRPTNHGLRHHSRRFWPFVFNSLAEKKP